MAAPYRFNFFRDPEKRLIIVRPIGPMPGAEFVDRLFDLYQSIDTPWLYNRLNDFRRYEGVLSNADLAAMAKNWEKVTAGQTFKTFVAVVSHDYHVQQRMPHVSSQFPNETICLFTGYHEAMGWLAAENKDTYLQSIDPLAPPRRDDGRIVIT